jgi:hypothetical protein
MATTHDIMTYVLLGIILLQWGVFSWNNHKIINKIMSRSFWEYKTALDKQKPPQSKEEILMKLAEADEELKQVEQEMGRIL